MWSQKSWKKGADFCEFYFHFVEDQKSLECRNDINVSSHGCFLGNERDFFISSTHPLFNRFDVFARLKILKFCILLKKKFEIHENLMLIKLIKTILIYAFNYLLSVGWMNQMCDHIQHKINKHQNIASSSSSSNFFVYFLQIKTSAQFLCDFFYLIFYFVCCILSFHHQYIRKKKTQQFFSIS